MSEAQRIDATTERETVLVRYSVLYQWPDENGQPSGPVRCRVCTIDADEMASGREPLHYILRRIIATADRTPGWADLCHIVAAPACIGAEAGSK